MQQPNLLEYNGRYNNPCDIIEQFFHLFQATIKITLIFYIKYVILHIWADNIW